MAFRRIGKTFKARSGKATTVIFNEEDLELLRQNLKDNEKYGKQVKLVITGTGDSQYGHSISLVIDDENGDEYHPATKPNSKSDEIDLDSLPI
jgi:hypothetical protein